MEKTGGVRKSNNPRAIDKTGSKNKGTNPSNEKAAPQKPLKYISTQGYCNWVEKELREWLIDHPNIEIVSQLCSSCWDPQERTMQLIVGIFYTEN